MNYSRLLLLAAVIFGAVSGWAQRMTKGLEYVRPRFGQQGTTVEVQLQGIAEALKNQRGHLLQAGYQGIRSEAWPQACPLGLCPWRLH